MDDLSIIAGPDGYIDPRYIAQRGFRSVLLCETFRLVEAEWLAGAITMVTGRSKSVQASSYDGGQILLHTELTAARDDIHRFVHDQNLYHSVLCDLERHYLAYFSQFRDFVLLCGDIDFLKLAYPVSGETIKAQYFFDTKIEAHRGSPYFDYFHDMWTRYSATAV